MRLSKERADEMRGPTDSEILTLNRIMTSDTARDALMFLRDHTDSARGEERARLEDEEGYLPPDTYKAMNEVAYENGIKTERARWKGAVKRLLESVPYIRSFNLDNEGKPIKSTECGMWMVDVVKHKPARDALAALIKDGAK